MMKFVFIIDTSPQMMLRSHMPRGAEGPGEGQSPSKMTYFQQAIFAIEEFVNHRKRLNEFKQDKYFLVRTLGRDEP
jgi:hypothetical protein